MRITVIVGVLLALASMITGCSLAFARYDLFERSDARIGRMLEGARRTCQERQPKNALPSAGEYERCVLGALQGTESIPERQ
jgi:hypothetical protein